MRVSFVHTKGGVGKTTSAMMVATAAANTGRLVEVYDTDRQGSAMRWAEIAQQRDDELPFPVISLSAQQLRDLPPPATRRFRSLTPHRGRLRPFRRPSTPPI